MAKSKIIDVMEEVILVFLNKGINKLDIGQVYLGDWVLDQKQGEGKEVFPNGSIYVGEYYQGSACGFGTLTSHNNDVYKGEWLKGYKHGKG